MIRGLSLTTVAGPFLAAWLLAVGVPGALPAPIPTRPEFRLVAAGEIQLSDVQTRSCRPRW